MMQIQAFMPEGIQIDQITAGLAKEFHEKLSEGQRVCASRGR